MSNILNIGLEPFQLMRDINGIILPEQHQHQPFTDINNLLLSTLSSGENVQSYYSIPESYRNSYNISSTDSPTTYPSQSPSPTPNQPSTSTTTPQQQGTTNNSSSKSKSPSPSLQVTPSAPQQQQYSNNGQLSPRLSHIPPQLQQQSKQQSQPHLQAQQQQQQMTQAQMQAQQQHMQQLHQQMQLQQAQAQMQAQMQMQQAQLQQQQQRQGQSNQSLQQVPQMYNPATAMQMQQQYQQSSQQIQQGQQVQSHNVQAQLLQRLQHQRNQHQQQQQQYQQQYQQPQQQTQSQSQSQQQQQQQQQHSPPQVRHNSSPPQQQVPSRPSSPTQHSQRSPSPSAPHSPPNQHASHSTPAPQQYSYGNQHASIPVPVPVQLHSQFQPQLLAPHVLPNPQAIQQYHQQMQQIQQQAQAQAQPAPQPAQSKTQPAQTQAPAPAQQKAVTPPPPVQQFLRSVLSSSSNQNRPPSPTPLEPLSPTVYQFVNIKDEQDPTKMRPLTEKQKNRRRASQNLASRNYRQRKKEYITTMEERATELEKDNEELKRQVNNKDLIIAKLTEENMALRASGAGAHIPKTDIENIDLEDAGPVDSNMQELIMKLESTLILGEDKSDEETDVAALQETLKLFYGSLQQRHERYTEQVKQIVNPCTQAKLSALDADPTSPFDNGFTENDDAWWTAFSADAKITEQQTVKIKQVRHDHQLEFQRLRNERRGLNKDIREYYKMVFSGAAAEEDDEDDVKMEELVEKLSALKQNLENEKLLILQTHSAMASILTPKQEAMLVTRSYNKVVRSNATIQMVTSMYGVLLKESALAKCCAPGWDL